MKQHRSLVPAIFHLPTHIFSFVLFVTMFLSCSSAKNNHMASEIPLLIITDFGRDVDDAQAFAYLAQNEANFKIAGVIATGYIPQVRAKSLELFLNLYGISIPVAIKEPEKTPQEITDYFTSHSINGVPYEITLLERLGSYPPNATLWQKMQDSSYSAKYLSPNRLIDSLLQIYPGELRVVVLAQATQLANYMIEKGQNQTIDGTKGTDLPSNAGTHPTFHSVYIQGQCDTLGKTISGLFKPDFAAYNLREDSVAAYKIFELQNTTPFIFLSKYATYPLAFTKDETAEIGEAGYAGDYLKNGAYMGLQSFLERDSATFYKVFKIAQNIPARSTSPNGKNYPALDSLKVVNNPYDLLTVMAIDKPELFVADTIYVQNIPHLLIDKHTPETPKKAFWFWK